MRDSLLLKICTVDRQLEKDGCDCVILNIAEDSKGGFSGSCGIRRGHAKAVFALSQGVIRAKAKDEVIFSLDVSDGFATVENDVVTVIVDRCNEAEEK